MPWRANQASDNKQEGDAQPTSIRRVFVPVDELDALIERDGRGVLLPKEQFEALYRRAMAARTGTVELPAAILLNRAHYEAVFEDDRLRLAARVEFTQLADGWQLLELPFAGMALERARLEGDEPARLGRIGPKRTLTLLNDRPGRRTLTLQWSVPLRRVASDRVASITLLPVASARLAVNVPAGLRMWGNGAEPDRPRPIEQQARYEIACGGTESLVLRFSSLDETPAADRLVFATSAYGIAVSPGELTWRATTVLDVAGAPIDTLEARLPRSLEIADVEATGLDSWQLEDDPQRTNQTILRLTWRQPFTGSREIRLSGLMQVASEQRWSVPALRLAGVTSHVGRILLRVPHAVRLEELERSGCRRSAEEPTSARSEDAGDAEEAGRLLLFDAWRDDFVLAFVTRRRPVEIQAALSTILDLPPAGPRLETLVTLRARFGPVFHTTMTLPAEWIVDDVRRVESGQAQGAPIPWSAVPRAAGIHEIHLQFDPPLQPGETTQWLLVAHRDVEDWPPDETPLTFQLPEVRLVEASVVEGSYLIKAADEFDLRVEQLRGLDPTHLGQQGERLGYLYQDTRFSGRVVLSRRPARIAATSLVFTHLDPQHLDLSLEVHLDVQGGGTRSVWLTLPEAVPEQVRFRLLRGSGRIVDQEVLPPQQGRRVWRISFDRHVRQTIVLGAQANLPRADDAAARVPDIRVPSASREDGYVAVLADADQRLDIQAETPAGKPLSEVVFTEMPAPLGSLPLGRLVAAYRFITGGYRVALNEQRLAESALPRVVVHAARLESVLGSNGEMEHRAEYRLEAVGVQSIRIALPSESRPWAVQLDGSPVEIRRDKDGYLVAWPAETDPSINHQLVVHYKTQPTHSLATFGRIVEAPLRLAAVDGRGRLVEAETLQTDWEVHYPRHIALIDAEGDFRPDDPFPRTGWLARLTEPIGRLSVREWLLGGIAVGVIAVVLLLFGLIYRRFGTTVTLVSFAGIGTLVVALTAWSVLEQPAYKMGGAAAPMGWETAEEMATAKAEPPAGSKRPPGGFDAEYDAGVLMPDAKGETTPASGKDSGGEGRRDTAKSDEPLADRKLPRGSETRSGPADEGTGKATDRPATTTADASTKTPTTRTAGDSHTVGAAQPALTGLLSLSIDLEPGTETRMARLKTLAWRDPQAALSLVVAYENRLAATTARAGLALAVAWLFWMARRRTLRVRCAWGILGVAVPAAIAPFVPLIGHLADIALDGVFLGSVIGGSLWMLRGIACWVGSLERPHLSMHFLSDYRKGAKHRAASWMRKVTGLVVASALWPSAHTASALADAAPDTHNDDRVTVLVPYDAEKGIDAAESVFLPQKEFLRLWRLAHPERVPKPPAPVDGIVSEAVYAASLIAAQDATPAKLAVTGRLVLHSFRPERVEIPLPLGSVAFTTAQLDGKPALITRQADKGQQRIHVLVDGEGLHVLDVQFELPVEMQGAAGAVVIPLRPVAAGTLSLALPDAELEVAVVGVRAAFRRRTAPNGQTVELPIDSAQNLLVTWRPPRSTMAEERIVHAETATTVQVDNRGLLVQSTIGLRVRQGEMSELTLRLPSDAAVRRIAGADLAGWEFRGADGDRLVRILFGRSVSDATSIELELFRDLKLAEGDVEDVAVPLPSVEQVTRETGVVGVYRTEDFQLRAGETSGLRRITADEFLGRLPERVRKSAGSSHRPEMAFAHAGPPVSLVLSLRRREPETVARSDHMALVKTRKVHLASRIMLRLGSRSRMQLEVLLPPQYLPLSVESEGLADWYVVKTAAQPKLVLEYDRPASGDHQVVLDGVVPKEPDDVIAEILVPVPSGVSRLDSWMAVWLDETYRGSIDELVGWRSVDPAQLDASVRRRHNRRVNFAFHSEALSPGSVALTLNRAEPRVQGQSLVVVRVSDAAVAYHLALEWRVARSAVDTVAVTAPDWLAGRLDFLGENLRDVTPGETEQGRARWILSLRQPVHDRIFLTAVATLPPPDDDRIRTPLVTLETAAEGFQPVAGQRRFAVMVNRSPARLVLEEPQRWQTVRPDELSIHLPASLLGEATEIYRLPADGSVPTWGIERLMRRRGAAASVNLARLTTVLELDGSWRLQADYTIRNRRRQFLPLRLPAESRLISAVVAGRPARAVLDDVGDETYTLIPLPQHRPGDPSFVVRVVVAGRVDPLPRNLRALPRRLTLPVLEVVPPEDDPEYGIPVMATIWNVYLPEEVTARPVDDPRVTNVDPDAQRSALEELATLSDVREWLAVLEEDYARSEKLRALKNLKKWRAEQLQSYSRTISGDRLSQEIEELERTRGELEHAVAELERRLQGAALDASEREATQADVSREVTREQFELYRSNAAQAVPTPSSETEAPTFRDKSDGDFGKPGEPADADEARLAGRSGLRRQSLSQLTTRNMLLESNAPPPVRGMLGGGLAGEAAGTPGRPGTEGDQRTSAVAGDDGRPEFADRAALEAKPESRRTGTISLPVEIPTAGNLYAFSKPGGRPQLTLLVGPRSIRRYALGAVWSLVWLLTAVVAAGVLLRRNAAPRPRRLWGMLCLLGVAVQFLLPMPAGWLGLLIFLIGAWGLAFPRRAHTAP